MPRYGAQTGTGTRVHIVREDANYDANHGPDSLICLCGLRLWPVSAKRKWYSSIVKEINLEPDDLLGICDSCKKIYAKGNNERSV